MKVEVVKWDATLKKTYSRVKPFDAFGKKTTKATGPPFQSFDFKTCWEACAAYSPVLVAIDGPTVPRCEKKHPPVMCVASYDKRDL